MKKVKAILCLQYKVQAFSNSDILALIPQDVLDKIKQKDPHPYFQAYVVAHEGEAVPRVLEDDEIKPITWTRKAIESIKNVITKGVQFFIGHNADSSTKNRESVGEIIADCQRIENGELEHIVIGYFPDPTKINDKDICSQEAEWSLFETARNYIADKIERLTAIALGNSDYEKPAFSGARRLGAIQAFEVSEGNANKDKTIQADEPSHQGDTMDLTKAEFKDLVAEIKRRQSFSSQIFTFDEIKQDREFKKMFDEYDQKIADAKKTNETLEETNKTLVNKIENQTATTRLDKIIKGLTEPLTAEQAKFVESNFKARLDAKQITDLSDEGLTKFVNEKKIDLKSLGDAGFFGEKNGSEQSNAASKPKAKEDDFTKAENNEFLEEDFTL